MTGKKFLIINIFFTLLTFACASNIKIAKVDSVNLPFEQIQYAVYFALETDGFIIRNKEFNKNENLIVTKLSKAKKIVNEKDEEIYQKKEILVHISPVRPHDVKVQARIYQMEKDATSPNKDSNYFYAGQDEALANEVASKIRSTLGEEKASKKKGIQKYDAF